MSKPLLLCAAAAGAAVTLLIVCSSPAATLRGHSYEVFTLAFAPDGKTLVSGSGDFHFEKQSEQLREYGELKFWNMETRSEASTINSDARFWTVAFSPDGKLAVTGGSVHGQRAGRIQVWDWRGPKQTAAVIQDRLVQSLAISPDGARLASVSYGCPPQLWDLPDLSAPVVLDGHSDDVKSVAFSPDGVYLATGSWDGMVKLWNCETAICVQMLSLPADAGAISTVLFSPDGSELMAASGNVNPDDQTRFGRVTCWDLQSGEVVDTLPHDAYVATMAFAPQGETLVTGSRDGLVTVWDLKSRAPLETFRHDGPIEAVAVSPNGQLLATAGRERECAIRLWQMPTAPQESAE